MRSLVAQAHDHPPEIPEIHCVVPAETAADKLSALTMSKVSGALDREDVVSAAAPGDQRRRRRAGDHLAANIGALKEVAASSPSSKFNSAKDAPEA